MNDVFSRTKSFAIIIVAPALLDFCSKINSAKLDLMHKLRKEAFFHVYWGCSWFAALCKRQKHAV